MGQAARLERTGPQTTWVLASCREGLAELEVGQIRKGRDNADVHYTAHGAYSLHILIMKT